MVVNLQGGCVKFRYDNATPRTKRMVKVVELRARLSTFIPRGLNSARGAAACRAARDRRNAAGLPEIAIGGGETTLTTLSFTIITIKIIQQSDSAASSEACLLCAASVVVAARKRLALGFRVAPARPTLAHLCTTFQY